MKSFLPILTLVLLFASCSTAYKTGQTPDDVYFSPARPQDEYVRVENKQEKYRYQDENYYDDRYLRMKVRNRRMWNDLDYYYSDPYAYNYNRFYYDRYYNSGWNPNSYWNYYYNPYGPQVIVLNPKAPVYSRPRQYNLHVFDDPQTSNPANPKTRVFGNSHNQPNYNAPRRAVGYSGSPSNSQPSNEPRSDAGNSLRNAFGGSSNSSSSSNNAPVRTETRSKASESNSSSSGSSSSGGSDNAPRRKF